LAAATCEISQIWSPSSRVSNSGQPSSP
jgi:hypothetical protein